MGAQQSQEKSSLLRNYQYLTDVNSPNAKLMYFDYLKFLKYEIDNKAWKWDIYKNIVEQNGGGGTDHNLFCGWKQIQQKIFGILTQQLRPPNRTNFTWKKDAQPLLDIAFNKNFGSTQKCSNINVDLSKINELQDSYLQEQQKSKNTPSSCTLYTAPNLHIPLRRRALLVKDIYDYINDIKNEFNTDTKDEDKLQYILKSKNKNIKVGSTDKNFNLTKDVVEGIAVTFGELIKQKHSTDDKAFCKEWERTMEDYYKLLQGIDIVDDKETNDLQCLIKDIENKVGGKTNFQSIWSQYFKKIVLDLWKKDFTNRITGKSCEVDYSEKNQCVRFFEEWAEEFCKLKKDLGDMMVDNCKDATRTNSKECQEVCNIYKKFLEVSEPYFKNYKVTCAQQKYGNGQNEKELQNIFINAAKSSMTDCCTELGDCSPEQLFNVKEDKGNIIYNCMCEEGTHTSNRDTKPVCQKYLTQNTVTGITLPAPPLSSASQTASAACGGKPMATVSNIALQLQQAAKDEAQREANSGGNVGLYGESVLQGDLSKAEFKSGKTLGKDDICQLKKNEHTNDEREEDQRTDGPCQGKDQNRFNIGERWKTDDGKVDTNHKDVLIPPRRKHMCTSNLENLNTKNGSPLLGDKVNHSFFGDVMLTAKTEAEKIIEQYKKQNGIDDLKDPTHQRSICNAIKYSFADLGDIIRGRDLWSAEKNPEMKNIQEKLKTIFGKIKEKAVTGTSYKNDTPPYLKLREYWWEANRKDIWQEMLCAKDGNTTIQCDIKGSLNADVRPPPPPLPPAQTRRSGGPQRSRGGYSRGGGPDRSRTHLRSGPLPPHDDYVPQRLRWLGEWAEWYCKKQSQLYGEVRTACDGCKNNPNCPKCKDCQAACGTYKQFITDWEKDWETQKTQYKTLYNNAHSSGGKDGKDENERYLNTFLYKLHTAQNSNTTYSTAGGYVKQVLEKIECEGQNEFCNDKDVKYAFKSEPKDYDNACKCIDTPPPPSAPTPKCTGNKVIDTATDVQRKAQKELDTNSKLKGEAHKGIYKNNKNGNADELKDGDICKIDKDKHTNDERDVKQRPDGPCTGKNQQRFDIGEKWKKKDKTNITHPEDYMPPRREHMCTSNLENLGTSGNLGNLNSISNVNDSFLGDVLLAAKYEGQFISYKLYDDSSRICNAMKYSFADLGDIIRGRDLWSAEQGNKDLQTYLEKIFATIYEKHDGIKTKYPGDANETPKYKKLREHWWEANRKEIWKAMTCGAPPGADLYLPTKDGTIRIWQGPHCGHDDPNFVPVDDYIPQRLRWMTEWSESYCRQVKADYDSMMTYCWSCKKYTKGNQVDENEKKKMCGMCKALCEVYTEHVKEWQQQWNEQKGKYTELYNGGAAGSDPIKQQQDDFINKLKDKNGSARCSGTDSTNYNNLAEYVTSMEANKYCKDAEQSKFEERQNTGEKGVFRNKPYKYDKECDWKDDPNPQPGGPTPPTAPPLQKKPCEIVKPLLEGKGGNDKIDYCNPKNKDKIWDCTTTSVDPSHDGACMSPRRQTLCIHNLKELNDKTSTQDDLREAFIKCAAKETFFLWHYFIEHGGGKNSRALLEKHLKEGTIPDVFKRQMMYTFGDFKDLCLNSDISVKNSTSNPYVTTARTNIDKILKNGQGGQTIEPKDWWEQNKEHIWNGMVCALSHTVKETNKQNEVQNKLTDKYKYDSNKLNSKIDNYILYADLTPQFLRWFTEWSEDFCTKYTEEFAKLYKVCVKCQVESSGSKPTCNKSGADCKACQDQCPIYKDVIDKWKKDYEQQKTKFDTEKSSKYKDVPFVDKNKNAHQNLDLALEMLGVHSSCMEEKSTQSGGKDMPASLDTPPSDYKPHCDCTDAPQPTPPQQPTCTGNKIIDAANIKQYEAQKDLGNNSGLVGKPELGTYKHTSDPSMFQSDICKIDIKHSNDVRKLGTNDNEYNGPCTGKGQERFVIGKKWGPKDGEVKDGHDNVLLPPRRLDMCTSNLENLEIDAPGLQDNKASHSLLGEVLLAAKYETGRIIDLYQPAGEHQGICRAVRSSFADLGDIIRGRDLWDKNTDTKKLQENLKTIFGKIKETDSIKSTGKYSSEQSPYTKLREHWWEANRNQVWKAMKCHVENYMALSVLEQQGHMGKFSVLGNCGFEHNVTPFDDYIPQRLRWMTEWVENFCKAQHTDYSSVKNVCEKCKNSGKCKKDGKDCKLCSAMCGVYKDHITEWQKQWEEQSKKYTELYQAHGGANDDEIKKQHEEFFKKVKNKDGCNRNNNTDYTNLADYVTSMGGNKYCTHSEQKELGVNTNTGDKGAFRDTPYKYDKECKCDKEDPAAEPPVPGSVPPGTGPDPPVTTPPRGNPPSATGHTPSSPVVPVSPGSSSSGTHCNGQLREIKELKDGKDNLKICVDNNHNSLDGTVYKQGLYFKGNKSSSGNNSTDNIPLVEIHNIYSYIGRGYQNPCGTRTLEGKKWICEKNGNTTEYVPKEDKVCLPPRTQILCVGNLNVDTETTRGPKGKEQPKIEDVDSPEKLLTEVLIAAKYEGGNLKNNYNKYNDKSEYFCSKVKYSFSDLADIIKGKKIYTISKDDKTEDNLDKIFGKIYENLQGEKTKYEDNGSKGEPKYKKLREDWWKANRKYVWEILLHGAAPTDIPDCLKKYEHTPPDIDGTPQILRFTQEWSDEYCHKRKEKANKVVEKCKECKEASEKYHTENTINSSSGGGTYTGKEEKKCENNGNDGECTECQKACEECKKSCSEYKKFVEGNADNHNDQSKTWRKLWKEMEEKYNKLIGVAKEKLEKYHEKQRKKTTSPQIPSDNIPPYMMKCEDKDRKDEVCLKPDEDSFFQNLADHGHTTLSSYMNSVSENMDCGKDKPKWGNTVVITPSGTNTTDKYPQPFGGKAVGYKYACVCKIPSRNELCDDNQLYRNRWDCSTSGASTPASNYELCRDKTTTTTATTNSHQPQVLGTKLSKEDVEFFNLFDLWYKDIQNRLDHNIRRIKEQCDKDKIMPQTSGNSSSSGNVSPLCLGCRDSCECYKLWVNHMKTQWEKQQSTFTKFVTNQKSKNSGATSNDVVDLNSFLFTSCWEDYLQKSNRGTDIEKLDANTDAEMIDVLIERCGEKKTDAENKFQERINKAEKQKNMCDKNQDRCKKSGNLLDCDGMGSSGGNVSKCGQKEYDHSTGRKKKDWKCTQGTGETLVDDVCVSPRTQSLCVANMDRQQDFNKIQEEGQLRKYIQSAMKKETENLYDYYKSGNAIISKNSNGQKGEKDPNVMPKNFCKAAERTYNDFKNLVTGDMLWKAGTFGDIHKKIDEIITKNSSGTSRKDWWEQNSDKFWEAIKCGIKGKPNGGGSVAGEECGRHPPDDTDNQFVWWFKEWGQQFCIERQKYIDAINDNCSSNVSSRCDGKTPKQLTGDCKTKCNEYKTFIGKKRSEWTQQKSKYERENPGMEAEELLGHDYPECLEANFENIFGDISGSNGNDYGDASDICSCDEQRYKCSNNKSTCKDKKGDVITWRTHLLKIGKHNKKLEGVYAPPRRQKLCLANLFPINFGKDQSNDIKKNMLQNRLQIVAEREAYYLWLQHVPPSSKDDTASHNRACCAIRSSFYDIGDIVKGTDLWDDHSKKYIDKTLNDLFKQELEAKRTNKKKEIHLEQIKEARKQWWEYTYSIDAGSNEGKKTIRDGVWDAMQCGVTNALKELGAQKTKYDEIDCMKDKSGGIRNFDSIPTPQFARWLVEWTHQFCEEYTKHMEQLKTKCLNSGSNNDCNDKSNNGCKNACTTYNDWITSKRKEWNGMSKYYENVKGTDQHSSPDGVDYNAVNLPTAIGYLNQKCKESIDGINKCCLCEKVGTDSKSSTGSNDKPLDDMDKVVYKTDNKYKQYKYRCTNCQLKHIKDQIEKIEKKIQQRKDKKAATSSSGKPQAAKPAPAKPAPVKPAAGGGQAQQPGKDSSSKAGSAPKPAATKPANTKPVVKPGVQPQQPPAPSQPQSGRGAGTKGQNQNQGQGTDKGAGSNCNLIDSGSKGDGGVCHGRGLKINTEKDGTGSIQISTASTDPPAEPDPGAALPAGGSTAGSSNQSTSGPTSPQSTPVSPNGSPGADPASQTTATKTNQNPHWWDLITKTAFASAIATGLGIAGTKAAIDTATEIATPIAKELGLKAANIVKEAGTLGTIAAVGIIPKASEAIEPILKSTVDTAISTIKNAISKSGGSPATANNNSQASGTFPGQSTASVKHQPGNSGTGFTGNPTPTGGSHTTHGTSQSQPGVGPKGPIGPKPPPSSGTTDLTNIITNSVLSTTIPWSVGVAFAGIVYLWLKKKPKYSPVDLVRVIDIPQNDYGIPDKTSTNRYVPYGKYKGKTYIYVEGDEPFDYSYIRDISSSDITSSSESEIEELDINDIYVPGRPPKYKTLIDLVLKPRKKIYDAENTHIDNIMDTSHIPNGKYIDIPSDNTPTYKLAEEEWNKLKQDFILNILQNDNMDIYRENLSGNTTMDTEPNTVDNSFGEKPFISRIQDRYLHGDNQVSYNINWNVPKNTQIYSNIRNIRKENSLYSGNDLINDSLNSDQPIDIYDELLKRKENELFGTKHKKNISTNSVAKETSGDPISNQIDLFDKWLDRHRDMFNQWNNKEEMLNQLNEEWNNENIEHILDTSSTYDDINKINDENYNLINTNKYVGNDKISLEDFGSTNIPYNDITTQNNSFQTKNLRTNISMDIHMDENNNIPRDNDYLQNSYNF